MTVETNVSHSQNINEMIQHEIADCL